MVLSRATLGLGGNIGTPQVLMAQALHILDARNDCAVLAVSRLYRTPPWGKVDQDWYVNACAEIATQLSPLDLLDL
ncbi:MAG: 2-amino-4-hydroxy-6-hydroxymethyldihydropteridine diphosphokinase, partial [Pseudomonadota bacterium]